LAAAPEYSVSDIVRTPSTPEADMSFLREAVTEHLGASPHERVPLDKLFHVLPETHRHLNTVRALIEIGRTNGESVSETQMMTLSFKQVDGTERTAILPALTFTKEPL
jgi:hypothetical protein